MRHLPIHDPTYREVLVAFEDHLRAEGYAPGSRSMLPSCAREFLAFLESIGGFRLDRIEANEVQRYYEHIRSRPNARRSGGLSSVMIGHHLFALRTFFAWLVRLEAIPFDPMTGLDFPRVFANPRIALAQADIKALLPCARTLSIGRSWPSSTAAAYAARKRRT